MAFALLLSTGFVSSCSDGDDNGSQLPENPTSPTETVTVAGVYGGWTLGSNEYAGFIPSDNDTLTITLTNQEGTLCDLSYKSDTWGMATLKGVAVSRNDTAYVFSKPVTPTIREDHSAWDFSADVDSIAMPNRNPQAGTVAIKNYPFTLVAGTMSLDKGSWQFDFKAYLVPRSEHIQMMSFRNGHVPSTQPGQ